MKNQAKPWEKPGRIWEPKPGQVITLKLLDEVGWFAAWDLPLPKRPSVELLNRVLRELWECPLPMPDAPTTDQDAESCCEEIEKYTEKLKAIARAYPAALKREKLIQECPATDMPF